MHRYEELLEKAMKNITITIEKKRFEIPEIIVEIQGQKTLIRNFSEIAKVFRRDEKHIASFLFKQLATLGSIKEGTLILHGNLFKEIIKRKIEEYAKIYVICKECKNPDTRIVKEGRIYFMRCDACGARNAIK